MQEKTKKNIFHCLIAVTFVCMVTFILLDICEVAKCGFAFGFVFGAIGTLIQTFMYWKQDRFKAYLQLSSAVIYAVLAVVLFIKNL